MSGESLVETVEKVSRSYSRDETRPVLTGILICFEDSRVRMVTTDSYRLSIKETELATTAFEGSREAIIPARAMQEVSRIFGSEGEERRRGLALGEPGAVQDRGRRLRHAAHRRQLPRVQAALARRLRA